MKYRENGGYEDPCQIRQDPERGLSAKMLVALVAFVLAACAGSSAGLYYAINDIKDPTGESLEDQMRKLRDAHAGEKMAAQEQVAYMLAIRLKFSQAANLLGEISRSDAESAADASRMLASIAAATKKQLSETAVAGRGGSEAAAQSIEAIFGQDR